MVQGKKGGFGVGAHVRNRWIVRLVGAVWGIVFCLFALCASKWHYGYERENLDFARAYVSRTLCHDASGMLYPRSRAGLLDVVQYVPPALLESWLQGTDWRDEAARFVYLFVNQFTAAWIIVALFATAWLLYRDPGPALATALLAAIGTVLWPYSKFGMENQQTLWTITALAAFLHYLNSPSVRRAVLFGSAVACLILTKITGVLIAIALGIAALVVLWRERDTDCRSIFPAHVFVALIVIGAALTFRMVTNVWRYGNPVFRRYSCGDAYESIFAVPLRLYALLFSPNKSLFLYSPVLLLTLPFWHTFFVRFPRLVPFGVVFVLLTVFQLSLNTWVDERWWFSRLHFLIPFLALPLGLWWERYRRGGSVYRFISNGVVIIAVVIQLIGVGINYTALTFVLHPSPQLTMENLVWNPQFNHIRFNVYALTSWWEKERSGRSLPFIVYRRYLPAAPPPGSPPPYFIFSMGGWDELDLWLFQELRHPQTELGRSIASTLVGVLSFGLLVSTLRLMRLMRYARLPELEDAAEKGAAVAEDSAKRPWRRKWRVFRIVRGKT